MIRMFCDLCGAEIAEYRGKTPLPEGDRESGDTDPMQRWDKCAKCVEILRMIDVSQLVKNAVLAMRADIPKEEKGADRQHTVRFVP